MAGGFARKLLTLRLAPGSTAVYKGFSSIDLLNVGTTTASFTGNDLTSEGKPPSVAVDLPSLLPWTGEFNPTGFLEITVDNPGGNNGDVNVVLKF